MYVYKSWSWFKSSGFYPESKFIDQIVSNPVEQCHLKIKVWAQHGSKLININWESNYKKYMSDFAMYDLH